MRARALLLGAPAGTISGRTDRRRACSAVPAALGEPPLVFPRESDSDEGDLGLGGSGNACPAGRRAPRHASRRRACCTVAGLVRHRGRRRHDLCVRSRRTLAVARREPRGIARGPRVGCALRRPATCGRRRRRPRPRARSATGPPSRGSGKPSRCPRSRRCPSGRRPRRCMPTRDASSAATARVSSCGRSGGPRSPVRACVSPAGRLPDLVALASAACWGK